MVIAHPLVSVIIPTYNRARYLKEALDSVFAQTFKDFEVIIVDDGSTDETEEAVKKFGADIVFIKQENKGPGAARNAAMKKARGEFLAFLDSDDKWLPHKLESQVKILNENPAVDMIFSDVFLINEEGQNLQKRLAGEKMPTKPSLAAIFECDFIAIPSVLIRKKVFADIGGFREDFFAGEDYDLWLRFFEAGYIAEAISEPSALCRIHNENISRTTKEECGLRALTEFLSRQPEFARKNSRFVRFRMKMSNRTCASNALKGGRPRDARKYALKTLAYSPLDARAFIYFILSFFPRRIVNFITNILKREAK